MKEYLEIGSLSQDPKEVKMLKYEANRFTILLNELYKRAYDRPLLKCLD